MLRLYNRIKNQSGFSLIESAIAMAVVGLLAGSLITYYHQYRIQNDQDTTENNLETVYTEIGNFRSIYGRYPCPASNTEYIGDLNYGREKEDCANIASGTCEDGVCATDSLVAGEKVIIGSIPFKAMNIQDTDTVDAYYARYSYAVTASLTDQNTFTLNGGGIRVEDADGNSLSNPENTVHFTVFSTGQNGFGSFSNVGGTRANCASATAAEQENCDGDSTFVHAARGNDFDDFIGYYSPVTYSQWERVDSDLRNIHLKYANSAAIGAQNTTDLSDGEDFTLRANVNGDGVLYASEGFFVDRICKEDETNATRCFPPRLFAGTLEQETSTGLYYSNTTQNGMSCYDLGDTTPKYLIGIEENQPVCEEEIFVSCPDGQFISKFDDGVATCSEPPLSACPEVDVQAYCVSQYGIEGNASETLPSIYSGGYSYVYSGECRKAQSTYNASYFKAQASTMVSYSELEDLITQVNNEDRVVQSCGNTADSSLVRDAYLCTDGLWLSFQEDTDGDGVAEVTLPAAAIPTRSHEIGSRLVVPSPTDFNAISATKGAPELADMGSHFSADTSNEEHGHDCWCREDFKVQPKSCPNASDGGWGWEIYKHRCPQTDHYWTKIAESTEHCVCNDFQKTETKSCLSYYNQKNGTSYTSGLTGSVNLTYQYNCVDNTAVKNTTPISVDTSGCACQAKAHNIQRTYCPSHETNSWSWSLDGATYTEEAVASVDVKKWICPGTQTNGLPDPAYYESTSSFSRTEACYCDNTDWEYRNAACPAGLDGEGRKYLVEWDCTTNSWEDESEWEIVQDKCYPCTWQRNYDDGGTLKDTAPGYEHGQPCTCGSTSGTSSCWSSQGDGLYRVYNACTCKANKT